MIAQPGSITVTVHNPDGSVSGTASVSVVAGPVLAQDNPVTAGVSPRLRN